MDNDYILHLTVSAVGVVSLWESLEMAQGIAKRAGEVYLALPLTPAQVLMIATAEREAK